MTSSNDGNKIPSSQNLTFYKKKLYFENYTIHWKTLGWFWGPLILKLFTQTKMEIRHHVLELNPKKWKNTHAFQNKVLKQCLNYRPQHSEMQFWISLNPSRWKYRHSKCCFMCAVYLNSGQWAFTDCISLWAHKTYDLSKTMSQHSTFQGSICF